MQPLVQDATKVLKSPSEWDNLQSNLDVVLTGLAKSPATVAAVHAVGSSELAAATAAVAAAGGGSGSDGSSALYLSSYKLFGLQLADSAFRRGFLVQVGGVRWGACVCAYAYVCCGGGRHVSSTVCVTVCTATCVPVCFSVCLHTTSLPRFAPLPVLLHRPSPSRTGADPAAHAAAARQAADRHPQGQSTHAGGSEGMRFRAGPFGHVWKLP